MVCCLANFVKEGIVGGVSISTEGRVEFGIDHGIADRTEVISVVGTRGGRDIVDLTISTSSA